MTRTILRMLRRAAAPLRMSGAALIVVLSLAGAPSRAFAQPPTAAAQDGFVPVDESKPQEHLPATPLVITAYGFAWLAILVYVWSLWSRLGKVEREIADVSRRVAGTPRS
jgi:CcmD family protein